MNNRKIAGVLFNISNILKAQHGNPYRIRAYQRAARNILRSREQISARIAAGKSLGIPGLGKSLTEKIATLAIHGELAFYRELCAELPASQAALLQLNIPSLGPQLAARIEAQLGNAAPGALRQAALNGSLQRVYGIGPRRLAAILDAVGGSPVYQERLVL